MTTIDADADAVVAAVTQHLGGRETNVTWEASPESDDLWFVLPTVNGDVEYGGTVYYVQLSTGRVVGVSGSLPPDDQLDHVDRVLGQG